MNHGPLALLAVSATVGFTALSFFCYQYPNEARSFKNEGLLKLVKSKWVDINSLNEDLKYLFEFDDKMNRLRSELTADKQNALLSLIANYIRLLNEGQSTQFLTNFRQAINSIFDLCIEFHEPIEDEVKEELKKAVSHDYPQVQADINAFVEQLVQYINNPTLNPKPNPLLLIGPPGVGKTRLVEDILQKGLNLHVYRASLANLKNEQLTGDKAANLCNEYNEGIVFSAVVQASRQKRRAPVIVFLDDICAAFTKGGKKVEESAVISWLTQTLDPELEEILSTVFNRYSTSSHKVEGVAIPATDVIFIAAANSAHFVLTEGLQRRLRSRVVFPAMTQEKKQEIAILHANELEQKAIQAVQDGTLDRRIEKLKEKAGTAWQTSAECERELAKVKLTTQEKEYVKFIATRDPYPGAGTLKDTLNKWYAAKKGGAQFDIEAYYQRLDEKPEDILTKSATFVPGFAAQAASMDELTALLANQLALFDEPKRAELVQRALEMSKKK
ncbi:MAG: ATP-binding protein [Proteobacteria bacterium]|nr:ATP-binding protein [Pseudomonadota bacterium]